MPEDADMGDWARMVQLNLMALLWSSHAALPHLLAAAEQQPIRRTNLRSATYPGLLSYV